MRIGIDFDNALANTDRALARAAALRGLLAGGYPGDRQALCRLVRGLPDGEAEWRRIEGRALGALMGMATLAAGAAPFLAACRRQGSQVFILVGRPQTAPFDPERTDLHRAALDWMADHRFFDGDGFGIPRGNVVFAATCRAKLDEIVRLGCSHFIDTADELFRQPLFPPGVTRCLLEAGDGAWDTLAAQLLA